MSEKVISYFERLKETKDVRLDSNKVVDSVLGKNLKCVKKLDTYKIYVDFFMSVKKYYVLNTETNEIRFGGVWNLSQLIEELQEDTQSA